MLRAALLFLISLVALAQSGDAFFFPGGKHTALVSDEEFVGPFANWINAKTGKQFDGTGSSLCTASTGNGSTDDTTAFQSCLTALGDTNPVLWVPAGTYKISSTVTVFNHHYIQVIGAAPSTTTLIWAGATNGKLFYFQGVSQSAIKRITFDGGAIAGTELLNINTNGGLFPTTNEISDVVFQNAAMGLHCGNVQLVLGPCAETTMLRDKFLNLTSIGVFMDDDNSLDMWIWYATFTNCAQGVGNFINGGTNGAGNFSVYRSIFGGSTWADIVFGHTGAYSFIGNYSTSARRFIDAGGTQGGDPVLTQGNTILDTTNAVSISQTDAGPLVLIDNVIRSASGVTTGPVVVVGSSTWGDLFAMGNTFTVAAPYESAVARLHSIDDVTVARSSLNPSPPTLPGTPPNNSRTIFEVTPTCGGSCATTIQTAINNAVAAGSKSVVHLQAGTYFISSMISTPANADIQIIGDGGITFLQWNGGVGGPMFRLNGPSKVIVRDIRSNAPAGQADLIEINTADQAGSRIFMEGGGAGGGTSNAGIFYDTLDRTLLEAHDIQLAANIVAATSAFKIIGGSSTQGGVWLGGSVNWFAGFTGEIILALDVSKGAHANITGVWNEASIPAHPWLSATGPASSAVTVAASQLHGSANPELGFSNFRGKAAVVGALLSNNLTFSGTATGAQNLGLGLLGSTTPPFFSDTSTGATAEFLNGLNGLTDPPSGLTEIPPSNPDATFLSSALNQLRTTLPSVPDALPAGVTDVRLYTVATELGINGIHIKN